MQPKIFPTEGLEPALSPWIGRCVDIIIIVPDDAGDENLGHLSDQNTHGSY